MPKLTETFSRKLPFSQSGTERFWDSELKGLVLYVGKRSKTWYFQKDVGGKTKRILIGRFPTISASAARQTAMELALEMGRGAGKRFQIGSPTLRESTEIYLARPKLRSDAHKHGIRAQFNLHLKDWLDIPLDEISRKMVVDRHMSLADRPSTANHTLKYFRTVWNHARRVHELSECPTMAIEWFEERPAADVIDNLPAWSRAIDELPNAIHKSYYQLLLFTGLRKTEALTLTWDNVHSGHIHLPMTKNGRSFDLPILDLHHDILEPMRGLSANWVFPSPKEREGRLSSPARIAWSPHAHRRSFATFAVEAGVLEEVVGRLLNHTPLTITGRSYVRPSLDALRQPMMIACDEIMSRMNRAPEDATN